MSLRELNDSMKCLRALFVLMMPLCLACGLQEAYAAKTVLIFRRAASSLAEVQVQAAATFYGLNFQVKSLADSKQSAAESAIEGANKPLALIITADALPFLDAKRVLAFLHGEVPVLITGIDEHTDTRLLQQWSGGAIIRCKRSNSSDANRWYSFADHGDVVQQLAGSKISLAAKSVTYLTFDGGGGAQSWMDAGSAGAWLPVFAEARAEGARVFFATDAQGAAPPASPDPYRQQAVFGSMAPALLFLKYAAGEYAWHSPGAFANFTIDDLWLREPYGHVNYEQLLRESKAHNFHTTIAFIPWNFDRSEAGVVNLFRGNPERLSICIHGNDHVHQEFGPLDSHSLEKQSASMRQGLARMAKFREMTGLEYDAVMVFPHSVSPKATFEELRRHDYLATANSLNVPSDSAAPEGADFALRTATLQFGGIPSLRRYSVETEIPRAQLAIDVFLGNPMLFYAHESFFASGIDAFNKTADVVNSLQPSTQWKGLGDITRHLYIEKRREDGDYDIRAYSGDVVLTNSHGKDAVFYLEKYENAGQGITVIVNGHPYAFTNAGSTLQLKLPIAAGASSEISIRLADHVDFASADIRKQSLRTNAIRLLSDFRDDTVSRSSLGRWFIRSYAANGQPWNVVMAVVAAGVIAIIFLIVRFRRSSRGGGATSPLHGLG
jgi:hypothetical protein